MKTNCFFVILLLPLLGLCASCASPEIVDDDAGAHASFGWNLRKKDSVIFPELDGVLRAALSAYLSNTNSHQVGVWHDDTFWIGSKANDRWTFRRGSNTPPLSSTVSIRYREDFGVIENPNIRKVSITHQRPFYDSIIYVDVSKRDSPKVRDARLGAVE